MKRWQFHFIASAVLSGFCLYQLSHEQYVPAAIVGIAAIIAGCWAILNRKSEDKK